MGNTRKWIGAFLVLALGTGCVSTPIAGGPPAPLEETEDNELNPVYIPLGGLSYGQVFENVLQVLISHGFEIQEANRYDGRIETVPRIAPGLGLFLKPGTPSFRDRLLYTLQTYRHRVSVIIQPADNGGYFIEVVARKELEDLAKPSRATAGAAIFRNENNVDRQYEVIDASVVDAHWIYKGRDALLEQQLIEKLKGCM